MLPGSRWNTALADLELCPWLWAVLESIWIERMNVAMAARTHAKQANGIITLTAEQSRQAFEDEVRRRLGKDARTFIDEWQTGKLDRQDPDVNFLLSLLSIYLGPLPDGA